MKPLALVTGSCRRLGAHIAARLAEDGYDLALHASASPVPEPWLVEQIERAGRSWHGFAADLDVPDAAERLVPAAADRFGVPVRLLVNSASRFAAGDSAVPSVESLVEHFRVNAAAPFVLAQAVAAQDLGPGEGAVVNILDQRIARPHRDQLAYTASKQALAEITRLLAVALAPGVRVCGVAPGLTLPTADYETGQMERLAAAMPLRRLPEPSDIADAVSFLARARASTGQILFVDGGASLVAFERDFVHLGRGGAP